MNEQMNNMTPAGDIAHYSALWSVLDVLRSGLMTVPGRDGRPPRWIEKLMVEVEMRQYLVGERTISASFNTISENMAQWALYHSWPQGGDEWTPSLEWKQVLVDEVMNAYIPPRSVVLEIGPGHGRWTEYLAPLADRLILVDVSESCLERCKARFSSPKTEFRLTDGRNLDFIRDNEVDSIWSWDVFVHINPTDIYRYLRCFSRVLKPGGRGVIHHAKEGGRHGGWRSPITDRFFGHLVRQSGMQLVRQLDSWGGGRFDLSSHHDVISIFQKPLVV